MRLIDADAMMERLKVWDTEDVVDKALFNFALNRVLDAPTVEPERNKGRWLLISDGYTDYVKCDQCGNLSYVERNFCPNCGANMRKGAEHELLY